MAKRRRNEEETSRKKASQSRIGRACDRCQHRKLACDPTEHSCQQCQKANTWCTITDSLSGIPAYRGEYDYLERRVEKQHKDIQELLHRLRSLDQDVSGFDIQDNETIRYKAWKRARMFEPNRPWEREDKQANYTKELVLHDAPQESPDLSNKSRSYESSPEPVLAQSYPFAIPQAGLPYQQQPLHYNKVLDPLVWDTEMHDMVQEHSYKIATTRAGAPSYNTSYSSFLATTQGIQERIPSVELPGRQKMFDHSVMYFREQNCHGPVLHEQSYLELLTKFYDEETFRPTVAQTVCVHMVSAIMIHQDHVQNSRSTQDLSTSKVALRHYHFCLGFWPQLLMGETLIDAQALALICRYTQSFSRPEPQRTVAAAAWNKIVRLQYHKRPESVDIEENPDSVDEELKRRVFWTVLNIFTITSGFLGRSMPLKSSDLDIRLPSIVRNIDGDIYSTETFHRLSLTIESFKLVPLYIELFSRFQTSQRRDFNMADFYKECEDRLAECLQNSILQMTFNSQMTDLASDGLQYRLWYILLHLLLRQNTGRGSNPTLNETSYATRTESMIRELFDIINSLKTRQALPSTWITCKICLFAIQITLLSQHNSKHIRSVEINFQQITDAWLDIIQEMSNAMGISDAFHNKVALLIDQYRSANEESIGGSCSASFRPRHSEDMRSDHFAVSGSEASQATIQTQLPYRSISILSAPPYLQVSSNSSPAPQMVYEEVQDAYRAHPISTHYSPHNDPLNNVVAYQHTTPLSSTQLTQSNVSEAYAGDSMPVQQSECTLDGAGWVTYSGLTSSDYSAPPLASAQVLPTYPTISHGSYELELQDYNAFTTARMESRAQP